MNEYRSAFDAIESYLRGYSDQSKNIRHREFKEEGFAGTRYRLRGPFDAYVCATYSPTLKLPYNEVPNPRLKESLLQLASETIIMLSECLKQEESAVRVITFNNEEDAKKILAILKSQINSYGFVSVAKYYTFCGIEATKDQNYIVWNNLSSVRVLHQKEPTDDQGYKDCWFLDLPKPVEIQIGGMNNGA